MCQLHLNSRWTFCQPAQTQYSKEKPNWMKVLTFHVPFPFFNKNFANVDTVLLDRFISLSLNPLDNKGKQAAMARQVRQAGWYD
jgi:hypothetical protein